LKFHILVYLREKINKSLGIKAFLKQKTLLFRRVNAIIIV